MKRILLGLLLMMISSQFKAVTYSQADAYGAIKVLSNSSYNEQIDYKVALDCLVYTTDHSIITGEECIAAYELMAKTYLMLARKFDGTPSCYDNAAKYYSKYLSLQTNLDNKQRNALSWLIEKIGYEKELYAQWNRIKGFHNPDDYDILISAAAMCPYIRNLIRNYPGYEEVRLEKFNENKNIDNAYFYQQFVASKESNIYANYLKEIAINDYWERFPFPKFGQSDFRIGYGGTIVLVNHYTNCTHLCIRNKKMGIQNERNTDSFIFYNPDNNIFKNKYREGGNIERAYPLSNGHNIFSDRVFLIGNVGRYCDISGNIITKFSHDYIPEPFRNGYASISKKDGSENRIIDKYGKDVVNKTKYVNLSLFNEGLAIGKDRKSGYWAFIRENGEESVKIDDKDISDISYVTNSAAVYVKNSKYGFFSKEGKVLFPPIFDKVTDFSSGEAIAKIKGKYGVIKLNIDNSCSIIIPFEYDRIEKWNSYFYICGKEREQKLVSITGNFILPYKNNECYCTEYHFVNRQKMQIVNIFGHRLFPKNIKTLRYQYNNNGYMEVSNENGYHGILSIFGEVIVPCAFDSDIELASDDNIIYCFTQNEMRYFYNSSINKIIATEKCSDDEEHIGPRYFYNGFKICNQDINKKKYSYIIDKYGNAPYNFAVTYGEISDFCDGIAEYQDNGNLYFGYIFDADENGYRYNSFNLLDFTPESFSLIDLRKKLQHWFIPPYLRGTQQREKK